MRKILSCAIAFLLLSAPFLGQAKIGTSKRLWVLNSQSEMVEYDPATFAVKQSIKVPGEVLKSPGNLSVNRLGQMLFASAISLPLTEDEGTSSHKVWIWNGQSAATIDQGVKREVTTAGSNQAVTETAPIPYLSADGAHLFWFANQARRLQRQGIDLSTSNTWQAWQTDLAGGATESLATSKFPDCRCTTGTCEETCSYGNVWTPEGGVESMFLMMQLVAGQTGPTYGPTTRYRADAGKWAAEKLSDPLQKVLDASSDGDTIIEAIPDTGCCGWVNESNDQSLVLSEGKKRIVFDERATYKNPDYDVSFYTSNAKISPDRAAVAMTVVATADANKPIQLTDEGQANPEESQQIRKALADLPSVEVKSMEDVPRRLASIPHAVLVGWIGEKELLVIEDDVLVSYNLGARDRRKSNVRIEDPARVFLR